MRLARRGLWDTPGRAPRPRVAARPGITRPCTLDRLGHGLSHGQPLLLLSSGGPEPLTPGHTNPGGLGGAVPEPGFRSPDPELQCQSRCCQGLGVSGFQPHTVPSQHLARAALPSFLALQSYSQAAWDQGVAGLLQLRTS